MEQLIECVPNFSEGRNKEVIDSIAKSIRDTDGCSLLFVDAGESTNRTVYTFVGNAAAVINGAFNAAQTAYQLIDMAKHKGEHPRFGAMDVCPFVPVRNATMDDCIKCSHVLGERLANELQVPVYLYGLSARNESRKLLPNIRAGEYENLPSKLKDPEWEPDYGETTFVARWGATAVGARNFLIAYNVNLLATKEQAHKISLNIRERGRGPQERGRLKCVQAIGWSLEERNLVQVSANITDCEVTKIYQVYEEVCKDAKEMKLPVLGSEIVGLVPLQSILEVADFYIEKEGLFVLDERSKVQLAVYKLGLSHIEEFKPDKRIIEYIIETNKGLSCLPLKKFISSVAARTATPGGGSVSAAVASMGVALCTMGGQMTYGRKKWEHLEEVMRRNIPCVHRCMTELIPLIDSDANAFDSYMQAMKMPKTSDEEITKREKAMQEGILEAIEIPMQVIRTGNECWGAVKEIAAVVNVQCLSDIQVGAKCLESGIWGAYQNVAINLPQIEDEALREKLRSNALELVATSQRDCAEVLGILERREK